MELIQGNSVDHTVIPLIEEVQDATRVQRKTPAQIWRFQKDFPEEMMITKLNPTGYSAELSGLYVEQQRARKAEETACAKAIGREG